VESGDTSQLLAAVGTVVRHVLAGRDAEGNEATSKQHDSVTQIPSNSLTRQTLSAQTTAFSR